MEAVGRHPSNLNRNGFRCATENETSWAGSRDGEHRVEVDVTGLAVGAYVVRVVTPGGTASGRLALVR